MAKVAPLLLDLDVLARELTASLNFADLLDTYPTYCPTFRVDLDCRYAWLAAAFNAAVARRGEGRSAWTPVNRVRKTPRSRRWVLPDGVFEGAEDAVKAWANANRLRINRSGIVVDRQRRKVAVGWGGLQKQLEDGQHLVRIADGYEASGAFYWAVPALAPRPQADAESEGTDSRALAPPATAAPVADAPAAQGLTWELVDHNDAKTSIANSMVDPARVVVPFVQPVASGAGHAFGGGHDVGREDEPAEPARWNGGTNLAACPYCGEVMMVDLLEIWGNDFQVSTCCEGLQEEVLWTLAHDPEGAQDLLQRMAASEMAGRPVRSVCDDGTFHLVLNYELEFRPIRQKEAKVFIDDHHEHNKSPRAWRWGAGVYNGDLLIGVVWVGRPVARALCQKTIVEVNRLCFRRDCPLALRQGGCSAGYRWAENAARARGFAKIITYTLHTEAGYTLRAARWTPEARVRGKSWNSPSRPRVDKAPTCDKVRWARSLVPGVRIVKMAADGSARKRRERCKDAMIDPATTLVA